MSIELKQKEDGSDAEQPLLDDSQKNKLKEKEVDEAKKSLSSPQRKHSANVVPFSVSLENMKKVSKYIQDVSIFFYYFNNSTRLFLIKYHIFINNRVQTLS